MRVAVVGHVEWATFARVKRTPAPGEIANATEVWRAAAGGGSVAAVRMAELAGDALFFTALGRDAEGDLALASLEAAGVRVSAARRAEPTRGVFVHLDAAGERSITTLGRRLEPAASDPLPWDELAGCDAVYFTAGDPGALRAARLARVLAATPRARATLATAGVALDLLVSSANDRGEDVAPGEIEPAPALVVRTEGARGGHWTLRDGATGRFAAAPVPGPVVDTYGAGDSFAAALTFALGAGMPLDAALARAAALGARALTERAPYARARGPLVAQARKP